MSTRARWHGPVFPSDDLDPPRYRLIQLKSGLPRGHSVASAVLRVETESGVLRPGDRECRTPWNPSACVFLVSFYLRHWALSLTTDTSVAGTTLPVIDLIDCARTTMEVLESRVGVRTYRWAICQWLRGLPSCEYRCLLLAPWPYLPASFHIAFTLLMIVPPYIRPGRPTGTRRNPPSLPPPGVPATPHLSRLASALRSGGAT